MIKRIFYFFGALVGLGVVVFFVWVPGYVDRHLNQVVQTPPYSISPEAAQLHAGLFIADLHDDLLLWARDPLQRSDYGHADIPRLIEGNVALQVFSTVIKTPWGLNYEHNAADSDQITPLLVAQRWPSATWSYLKTRALYQANRLYQAAAASDGALVVVRSAGDLRRFLEGRTEDPHRVAGLLAIEGLHALEGQLENVDVFFDAGFRMMGLAHFFDNEVAGSAHGVEKGGLTGFGRQVVARMEALGLIIDLAHASPQTITEVLDMATRPVVVSHTGVQATCPGPRNLTDAQIRRIAEQGGLIGIGFWEGAVCDVSPAAIARTVRHVVDLVGMDHVGLGSDFNGAIRTCFDASGLGLLTEALLAEGFSEQEIRKIMGGNTLRFLLETLPPQM